MSSKQSEGKREGGPQVGAGLVPAPDKDAAQGQAQGQPLPDAGETPALRKPIPPGHCRVYIEADSQRESFVDPQTHLGVTKTPRDVPEELVGSGCELATDVIVELPQQAEAKQPSQQAATPERN